MDLNQFLTVPVVYYYLLLAYCTGTQNVFLETPAPRNVTAGDIANFKCRADTTVISVFFVINGTSANMLRNDSRISTLTTGGFHMLRIVADVEYDNSMIQCGAIIAAMRILFTDPVLLRVQGLLSAPANPNVANINGLIPQPVILHWDAPFSLDITDVDPDISNYTVFITNLNTSRNGSVTVPGTEFEFTNLQGEAPNPCYFHSFTVSAVNLAGEGNSSEPVMGNIRGVPQAVQADSVEVVLAIDLDYKLWNIAMEYELAPPNCPGVETFIVNVSYANGSTVYPTTLAEPTVNSIGNTPSNGVIKFTTFDLQNMTFHLNGTITCRYITGSAAQGCLVIAYSQDSVVYVLLHIHESSSPRELTFVSSEEIAYDIIGFDLEQNGMFGMQAAVCRRNASIMGILVQKYDITAVSEAVVVSDDSGCVCVNCTLVMGSGAIGCVTILHSLKDMQQLLHHIISQESSLAFAQGCFLVPVLLTEKVSLAIFAIGSNGPLGTAPAHVTTITVHITEATISSSTPNSEINGTAIIGGALAMVVIVVVTTVFCICYYYKTSQKAKVTIEMKVNAAYEVHQLPQPHPQPAELQPCSAYGVLS